MKILLVTSPLGRKEMPVFPLGLAYIAAMLTDHAVIVEDLSIADKPLARLTKILETENPDAVCISLRYIDTSSSYDKFSYYPAFIACVKEIKKIKRNTRIIAGGAGFTLFAGQIMKEVNDVDFGILLEGEETIVELLRNLDAPYLVRGICYRNGGEVHFTDKRGLLDFNGLPLPKRDILDINNYKYFPEQMGVQTKRGCVFRCVYCSYPHLSGNGIRAVSPEKVVDDIQQLTRMGIKKMFFTDCMFNHPREHAVQVCREIIKRKLKIRWKAFFNEKFMDQQIFSLAKEAGCEVFIFGPDGCSPETLKSLKKNFSHKDIIMAYNLFKGQNEAGFKCAFMFNVLNENIKTFFSILKLVLILSLRRNFQFSIGNMRVYPETELYYIALNKKLITKRHNLINPFYYDPFPLNFFSFFLNYAEKIIYTARRLWQCGKIKKG